MGLLAQPSVTNELGPLLPAFNSLTCGNGATAVQAAKGPSP